MNDFFKNLAAKSLTEEAPALRPRTISRFEEPSYERAPDTEFESKVPQAPREDVPIWRHESPAPPVANLGAEPSHIALPASRVGGAPGDEPHDEEGRFAARLRELEDLFRRALPPMQSRPAAASLPAMESRPAAAIPGAEHDASALRHEPRDEPPPAPAPRPALKEIQVRQIERHIERQLDAPTIEAPLPVAPAPVPPARPERPSPAPSSTPATPALRPSAIAVKASESPARHNREAAPTIVVERLPGAATPAPTVHVSIGRIEVRPPSPPDKKPPPSNHAAPKIMTLDDYMRRRRGGAP